ncbi:mitochondrial chaperone BCS1-like [Paramacrobiotus metropolitanus]|uniref:mitochondrial chaperone BCS1-like n=1 Tax=Paramacrobiotus metropolitanus TaxID=2943436 RepID=UPI0024461D88|nr:mitochondrial chaperone BCS1-like [Paramacrobiotus metropolitanus]
MVASGPARHMMAEFIKYLGNDPYIAIRILVVVGGVFVALVQKLIWNVSIADYMNFLAQNPYFGATFGIMGVGAGLACLQQIWTICRSFYTSYMTSSLQIPSTDQSFNWVLQWIFSLEMENQFHISVNTTTSHNNYGHECGVNFDFIPNEGVHFFRFNNQWVQVSRTKTPGDRLTGMRSFECITLTVNSRDTSIYKDILNEAHKYSKAKDEGKTQIYYPSGGSWYSNNTPRYKRPLESVVLEKGVAESIMEDLDEFFKHAKWYLDRGIPYHRGYLLYGPPGTGKTSFITALAGHYNMDIGILNLSDRYLTDDTFNQLLTNAPNGCILLLEDVDAAFVNREEKSVADAGVEASDGTVAHKGVNALTFSGFLNALDGVVSGEGRILIMTTNYIDRLDAALVRPGRVDFQTEIGYASRYQLEKMYARFYPEVGSAEAESFAEEAYKLNPEITLAQVQGLFLRHKHDPKHIRDDFHLLLKANAGPRRHNL